MELKEIKLIIDLMTKNNLTEFELERDNIKIRIKRGSDGTIQIVPSSYESVTNGTSANNPLGSAITSASSSTQLSLSANVKEIKSPMVGTFYRSPSTEAAHYIEIGQSVTEDTVVCIIEAMKVMNEIKAEVRGVITEVLVENAKPVEFGKSLFRVKTS